MAGVIAHIFVAKQLLNRRIVSVSNINKYILGSIAPDAIMSKDNYVRDDKKISHLRKGISSDDWYLDDYKKLFSLRTKKFYTSEIKPNNDEFALGYLIHLLTDQAFHYIFRQNIIQILKRKGLPYNGKSLLEVMVHELDVLDYNLLRDNSDIISDIKNIQSICAMNNIDGIIDSQSLYKNFKWIESKFVLSKNRNYKFKYFKYEDINELIENSEKFINDALCEIIN